MFLYTSGGTLSGDEGKSLGLSEPGQFPYSASSHLFIWMMYTVTMYWFWLCIIGVWLLCNLVLVCAAQQVSQRHRAPISLRQQPSPRAVPRAPTYGSLAPRCRAPPATHFTHAGTDRPDLASQLCHLKRGKMGAPEGFN